MDQFKFKQIEAIINQTFTPQKMTPSSAQWALKQTFGILATLKKAFKTSLFEKFSVCSITKWSHLSSNSYYFLKYVSLKVGVLPVSQPRIEYDS